MAPVGKHRATPHFPGRGASAHTSFDAGNKENLCQVPLVSNENSNNLKCVESLQLEESQKHLRQEGDQVNVVRSPLQDTNRCENRLPNGKRKAFAITAPREGQATSSTTKARQQGPRSPADETAEEVDGAARKERDAANAVTTSVPPTTEEIAVGGGQYWTVPEAAIAEDGLRRSRRARKLKVDNFKGMCGNKEEKGHIIGPYGGAYHSNTKAGASAARKGYNGNIHLMRDMRGFRG